MNKQSIQQLLTNNHKSFVNYVLELSEEDFNYSYSEKWSAGQQLNHILLCVQPLVKMYSMTSPMIEQMFGHTNRPGYSYNELLTLYYEKFNEGGKAPDRFVPEVVALSQRKPLSDNITDLIQNLCSKIDNFSDDELDTLQIPHPLLGNITLREMLYNAIAHVAHHHQQTQLNLLNKSVTG